MPRNEYPWQDELDRLYGLRVRAVERAYAKLLPQITKDFPLFAGHAFYFDCGLPRVMKIQNGGLIHPTDKFKFHYEEEPESFEEFTAHDFLFNVWNRTHGLFKEIQEMRKHPAMEELRALWELEESFGIEPVKF